MGGEIASAPLEAAQEGASWLQQFACRRLGFYGDDGSRAWSLVMPFTVQLDLDAETEAALCDLADRLAATPGLETVRQIGDVHHMSLGVYDELPLDRFLPKLVCFAKTMKPIDVRLTSLGIFPGVDSVLFVSPVVTGELLELHRGFHEEFAAFASSCWDHYHPSGWVPHITLAMNAKAGALQDAIAKSIEWWKPTQARLDALRLIEFRPVRTVYRHSL
jgi:2'-5' RNA ligase